MPPTTLASLLAVLALAGCNMQKEGREGMANANALSCKTERDMVRQAVENYTILEGKPPADEAALVPDYMRTLSTLMDLSPTGVVVASPGGGC